MNKSNQRLKIDTGYWVHWLIFAAVVMAVLGSLLQWAKYGGLVESGSIGIGE